MAYSSKLHRSKLWRAPSAIGFLPIPDPRKWPAAVRERFEEFRGDCGPLDVLIFLSGPEAGMYLQDAVTAVGILDVDPSGWHIEGGYPALCFDSARVAEYAAQLRAYGYAVRVVERSGMTGQFSFTDSPRAQVVNIATARPERKER